MQPIFKVILFFVVVIFPLVPALFAIPWVSTAAIIALVAFWILEPTWGPWLYLGICLNLMQWRAWQLYIHKLKMSVYLFSPAMATQNASSLRLSIGAAVGVLRSLIDGDVAPAILGALVGLLLFGLQGILFPNAEVIAQGCGYPNLSPEDAPSFTRLMEKADYQTLLNFNKRARKLGLFGPMLAVELAKVIDEKESQAGTNSQSNQR